MDRGVGRGGVSGLGCPQPSHPDDDGDANPVEGVTDPDVSHGVVDLAFYFLLFTVFAPKKPSSLRSPLPVDPLLSTVTQRCLMVLVPPGLRELSLYCVLLILPLRAPPSRGPSRFLISHSLLL